jgi:RNA polymerase sigma-70 factor (ECF subfamily)
MQMAQTMSRPTARSLEGDAHAPTDVALLQRIAGHDQSALRMLLARHNVRVFRFAMSLTKNQSLAEEIVSDVFFEVWRRADSFKGRSQVLTWLLAIARNKAMSSLRRTTHERLEDEFSEAIEDTAVDPETAMERQQAGTILADCLVKLPAIHREIIDLVYYHQMSVGEVAEILNIPINTAKTRMFYARKRIAELMVSQEESRRFIAALSGQKRASRLAPA